MADAEYFKLDDGTVLAVADAAARQKVGSAELQTTAKDCSGAINELKQSLVKYYDAEVTINQQNVRSFTVTLTDIPLNVTPICAQPIYNNDYYYIIITDGIIFNVTTRVNASGYTVLDFIGANATFNNAQNRKLKIRVSYI